LERDRSERGLPSAQYRGPGGDENLAQLLGRIARELQAEGGLQQTLHAVVASAVMTIPGAELGGIIEVLGRGLKIDVRHASDPLVPEIEVAQYETGQGPCLDAAYQHETVRVDDLSAEVRWPAFTARARDLGVRSILAFQLYVDGDDLGSLNLYSSRAGAFDDESEDVGLLFATHAAVAMAGARREGQLRNAINSRDVIGQAKGILMERHKIDADQAFALLTRASSTTNRKVIDIAEELSRTGLLASRQRR
jgi:GAF domain-containing protein